MWFAPDDEMIETLAPDRSDQPFSKAILPRRSRCDGLVPYAHGTQTAGDDGAVDAIPTAKVMALLVNPADRNLAQIQSREVLSAARNRGLELHVLNVIECPTLGDSL